MHYQPAKVTHADPNPCRDRPINSTEYELPKLKTEKYKCGYNFALKKSNERLVNFISISKAVQKNFEPMGKIEN